jgi:hypothetical protein
MTENSKHNKCPICGKDCKSIKKKNEHLEEKHDNVQGPDVELNEMTEGMELLTEPEVRVLDEDVEDDQDKGETMTITKDDVGTIDLSELK